MSQPEPTQALVAQPAANLAPAQVVKPIASPGKLDAYDVQRFEGAATLVLTPEEQRILSAPLGEEEIQHDSDRNLDYAGHAVIRDRLNRALGIGAWALRPLGPPMFERGLVLSTWDLYVRGAFVARATGECAYVETNRRMTWGDAVEGSKSNALCRCAKDLGVALELFNKKRRSKAAVDIKRPRAMEAPHSVAPDNDSQQHDHDANMFECVPLGVEVKSGDTKGKDWKRYGLNYENRWYGTFDTKIGDLLVEADEQHLPVRCYWEQKGDKFNIVRAEMV